LNDTGTQGVEGRGGQWRLGQGRGGEGRGRVTEIHTKFLCENSNKIKIRISSNISLKISTYDLNRIRFQIRKGFSSEMTWT